MIPRSKAGQQIVAQATGASQTAVQAAPERVARLEKPNRDVKLGLRFGLHPQTKQVRMCTRASAAARWRWRGRTRSPARRAQVIVSELYSGYPAQQSGKIFMGDVVTSINGVKITGTNHFNFRPKPIHQL